MPNTNTFSNLFKQNVTMLKIRFSKKSLFATAALLAAFVSNAGILTLTGVYQNKNLYVQNPFAGNMRDYCTNEVYVNDVKREVNVNSSAYEIDLSFLKVGDPVTVKIAHKDDCKPKVLNPQVIKATSAFVWASFTVDKNNIYWSTRGEVSKGKMFIEQMRLNTWVIVKEVSNQGSAVLNNYQVESFHHSGLNQYRIKYLQSDGQVFYSPVVEFTSDLPPVSFYPKRVTDKIYLSREVEYEIQDAFGNMIRKGVGQEIDIASSPAGVYYLNCDNQTFKVYKK